MFITPPTLRKHPVFSPLFAPRSPGASPRRRRASFQLKYYHSNLCSGFAFFLFFLFLSRLSSFWQRWDVTSRPTARSFFFFFSSTERQLLLLLEELPAEKDPFFDHLFFFFLPGVLILQLTSTSPPFFFLFSFRSWESGGINHKALFQWLDVHAG